MATPISAVIYDMDGLLLDTEPFYTEVTQEIVGRYGKTFDWSIKAQMIGRPSLDSARYLVAALELPISPEEYVSERQALLVERFPHAQALPGARELVEHLHSHRVPQALATSSTRDLYDLKTRRHGSWFDCFDSVVCGDDPEVKRGKPAPDIFLLAASRLNVAPAQCLVFEDAPAGMQAALAGGMSVVVVPDPAMDASQYGGAQSVLSSLTQFAPEHWGLPAKGNLS